MSFRFAVDSAQDSRVVYDAVLRSAARRPWAWFRYLSSGGVGATPIMPGEVSFLHSNGIAVGLVWNDVGRTSAPAGTTSAPVAPVDALARESARRAAVAARAVSAPEGVALWADLEYGISVDPEWLVGWADGVRGEGFLPGYYASMRAPYWRIPWNMARRAVGQGLLWCADWDVAMQRATADELLANLRLPVLVEPAAVYQVAGDAYGGLVDLDVVDPALLPVAALWRPVVHLVAAGSGGSLRPAEGWRVVVDGATITAPLALADGDELLVGIRMICSALGATVAVHGQTVEVTSRRGGNP
jgi:hypothetical protein